MSNVIDTSKIWRARKRKRNEVRLFQKEVFRGIFYDGQKDKSLINTKYCGALHRRTVTEKHSSLIKEPESVYLGHLTSTAGTAIEIKKRYY